MIKLYDGYLTEDKLGQSLEILYNRFPEKQVKVPGTRYRSDFMIGKIIVEFDGYYHFTKHKTIQRDYAVKKIWEDLGYQFVSVPYFIQLSTETIKYYFGIDIEVEQSYENGFIDKDALRPKDFNRLGHQRFLEIVNNLPVKVYNQLIKTMEVEDW